ncbi:MAG TPA: hypothetical protein DCS93_30340 [Microscillaceae bacterium]|nr:hypothetical protein [Microscillaceae bacterium]
MKNTLLIAGLILALGASSPTLGQRKITSTKQLLKAMKKRYGGKWFNAFTFVQKTIRYNRTGQPRDTTLWYEAIHYPNNFRIDYGHPSKGNAVLFTADTAYRFRKGKLATTRYNPQYFLLLKGGLYHRTVKECLKILKKGGYRTENFHTDTYRGRPVYVIGASKGDLKTPQFWIDQAHFYIVRRTQKINPAKQGPDKGKDRVLDVQYQNHKATGGGWVEQIVRFEVNGRLVQIEEYTEIDTSPNIPKNFFDPQYFGKAHWYK